MKRGDLMVLALCLLLAAAPLLLLFSPETEASFAVVRQNGRIVTRLSLEEDVTLPLEDPDGGHNVLQVQSGQVRILSADCPDQTCVRQGAISRAGETLVCLPHRLTVTLEGGAAPEADAVTQ